MFTQTSSSSLSAIALVVAGLALTAAVWVAIASETMALLPLLVLCFLFAACLAAGVVVLSWVGPRDEPVDALEGMLCGAITISTLLLGLAMLSPVGMVWNSVLLVLIVVATLGHGVRRGRLRRIHVDVWTAGALMLIAVASTFWSQENLAGLVQLPSGLVSRPWHDIFFHAQQVGLFAHAPSASSLENPGLAGEPLPLYHHAGYMLTSALVAASKVDAYSATAGFYPALGILLTGLAAYSVGRAYFGAPAGFAAAAGLLLIPDPSYQGLGARWIGYDFFQTVGVSGAYAVAVMGLAWSSAVRAARGKSWPHAMFTVIALALVGLYKAPIFLAYSVVIALILSLVMDNARSRLLAAGGIVLLYLLGLAVLSLVPQAPTIALSTAGAEANLQMIFSQLPHAAGSRLQAVAPEGSHYIRMLLVGIPVIVLSTYGLLVPLAAAAAFIAWKRRLSVVVTGILPVTIGAHLLVALTLAPNQGPGDAFELIHKTFVWPYFMVCVWTCAVLGDALARSRFHLWRLSRAAIAAVCVVGLVGVYFWGQTVQSGMGWRTCVDRPVPKGMLDGARFVRRQAGPGEILQYSRNDSLVIVGALSERPTFVRTFVLAGRPSEEALRRFPVVRSLLAHESFEPVMTGSRKLGIGWLMLSPDSTYAWESGAAAARAFAADGYRVYDLR